MIVVVIVLSGFRDRMHCTSLLLVIAHPICPPALDSAFMIPHVGFYGRWPIGLSSLSVELGIGGLEHGHSFPEGVRAPISARYSALWTWVSSRRRSLGRREREDKDLDTHPYTEGGWEGRRQVSSTRRYRRHGLLDCRSGTCKIRSRDCR